MAEAIPADVVPALVVEHERSRVGSRAGGEEVLQSAVVKAIERGAEIGDAESAIACVSACTA
jgi:hypothetical protein